MATDPLTPELVRFIARYIHSVEQLEILCLVSSNPSKTWTAAEVLREIQSSQKSVSDCLQQFQEDGFFESKDKQGYRFCPNTGLMDVLVRELSKMYRERRVTVVETIYKKPAEAAQEFADAFRFRKEK